MKNTEYVRCPHCQHSSSIEHWDDTTKEVMNISSRDPYISIGDDPEELLDVGAYFRCPICEDEVEYKEIKDNNI